MCEETASNKVMILSKAIMVHTACGTKRILSIPLTQRSVIPNQLNILK